MTSKEKAVWLSRYKSIVRQIWLKIDEKNEWITRATKITPTYSDMPKGGQQTNKIETATEKLDEISKTIDVEIGELLIARKEIEQAIKAVDCEKYRELLERRYIRGQRWEEIAVEMNFDYRWVLRLHGKALNVVNTPLKAT